MGKKKKKVYVEQCWTSELQVHKKCPYNEPIKLVFSEMQIKTIQKMDKEFELEFSIYFNVGESKDGSFRITEMWVPEQEVTSVSVDYLDPKDACGVIHKHPSGMNVFSTTDEEFINANHDFSLLLVDGAIKTATARKKMPCGSILQIPVKTVIESKQNPEVIKFVDDAKTKIKERTYEQQDIKGWEGRKQYIYTEWMKGLVCSSCNEEIKSYEDMRNCFDCGDPLCIACHANSDLCDECLAFDVKKKADNEHIDKMLG